MKVRCEVVFKGSVQGVGFRFTARDLAREAGLNGWVKNCPDGSVQLVAEGESSAVDQLINTLEKSFMVREKLVSQAPFRGDLFGFNIVH